MTVSHQVPYLVSPKFQVYNLPLAAYRSRLVTFIKNILFAD